MASSTCSYNSSVPCGVRQTLFTNNLTFESTKQIYLMRSRGRIWLAFCLGRRLWAGWDERGNANQRILFSDDWSEQRSWIWLWIGLYNWWGIGCRCRLISTTVALVGNSTPGAAGTEGTKVFVFKVSGWWLFLHLEAIGLLFANLNINQHINNHIIWKE